MAGIKEVFKVSRKTFVDPKAWLGYDNVKDSTGFLWRGIKGVFFKTLPQDTNKETFDEAVARLNLNEQGLQDISKTYWLFSVLFLGLGLALVALSIYFWLSLLIADGVISLSIAAFLFGQAFIFNFWHFQMKNRKLGCTFDEWRHGKPGAGDGQ